MTDLLQAASNILEKKYNPPIHTVAAALRARNGEMITAVNIDHFLGFVCAETAALNIAINQGIYDFDEIVAVRRNSENEDIKIVSMCGKCRQIFHDYAPNIKVQTSTGAKTIEDILPDAFMRQQQKIQERIRNVQ